MPKDILSEWHLAKYNQISVKLHDEARYRIFVEHLFKIYRNKSIVEDTLERYHQTQTEVLTKGMNDIWRRIWGCPEMFGTDEALKAAIHFAFAQSLESMITFFMTYFPEKPPGPPSTLPKPDPNQERDPRWPCGVKPHDWDEANYEEKRKKFEDSTANILGKGQREPERTSEAPTNQTGPQEADVKPERKYKRPCKMPSKPRPEQNHQPSKEEVSNASEAPAGCKRKRKRSSDWEVHERLSNASHEDAGPPMKKQATSEPEQIVRPPSGPEDSHGRHTNTSAVTNEGNEREGKYSSAKNSYKEFPFAPNSGSSHGEASNTSEAASDGRDRKRKRSSSVSDTVDDGSLETEIPASKRAREPSVEISAEEDEALLLELFGDEYLNAKTPPPQPPDTPQSNTGQEMSQPNSTPPTSNSPPSSPRAHTPSTTGPRSPQLANPSSSDLHPTESASPTSPASH